MSNSLSPKCVVTLDGLSREVEEVKDVKVFGDLSSKIGVGWRKLVGDVVQCGTGALEGFVRDAVREGVA